MKAKAILILLAIMAVILAATWVRGGGQAELESWTALNQILTREEQPAYYHFFMSNGVDCTAKVVTYDCGSNWMGDFWANMEISVGEPCDTLAFPRQFTPYSQVLLATWSSRIYVGDAVQPDMILNSTCNISILAGNEGDKKNVWVEFLPINSQTYP